MSECACHADSHLSQTEQHIDTGGLMWHIPWRNIAAVLAHVPLASPSFRDNERDLIIEYRAEAIDAVQHRLRLAVDHPRHSKQS
jgi:hypothetical protein